MVVGGESGTRARPMRKEWVDSIFWQRRDTGVPFFFQQWGGVHKDLAGREVRGRTFNQMPSVLQPA